MSQLGLFPGEIAPPPKPCQFTKEFLHDFRELMRKHGTFFAGDFEDGVWLLSVDQKIRVIDFPKFVEKLVSGKD